MSRDEAFLQAIAEEPGEDTPRLIYADWLDEHDESDRAEFIRVQCALECLLPGDSQAPDLRRRASELLGEREAAWLGEWSERLVRWTFRRGFLDAVVCTPGLFLKHGGELFQQHPLRQLAFVNDDGTPVEEGAVPELAASPYLAPVRSLDATACHSTEPFYGMYAGRHPGPAWCQALAKASHVNRLEELLLGSGLRSGYQGTTPAAFAALSSAPHLHTLRSLDLNHAYSRSLGDEIADLLAEAVFADNLETLILDGTDLTDSGARRLAQTPALARLKRLHLNGCHQLSAAGLQALLDSSHLNQIVDLGLAAQKGLLHGLATSPRLAQITALYITSAHRDSADTSDWRHLARSSHLRLRRLTLKYDAASEEGIAAMLTCPGLADLEELRIDQTDCSTIRAADVLLHSRIGPRLNVLEWGLGSAGSENGELSSWPPLSQLTELTLRRERRDDFRSFFVSPHFSTGLTRLYLEDMYEGLTSDEIGAVAACPRVTTLTWLGLPFGDWTASAMDAVLASPYLQNLEALHLGSLYECTEALLLLAHSSRLPRLRDVVIGSQAAKEAQEALRGRFGSRLRIFADC